MSKMHQFNESILREYDVRGIVGETLFEEDATALGRAFGSLVIRAGGKKISLGYDGRLSSPKMEKAILEGVLSTGVDVLRVGLGPTPMLYYSVFELDTHGGIMITGSHNPESHNGFKMMLGKGGCYGQQIQELGKMSREGDLEQGQGTAQEVDIFDRYIDRLIKDVDMDALKKANISMAWDAGNGAATRSGAPPSTKRRCTTWSDSSVKASSTERPCPSPRWAMATCVPSAEIEGSPTISAARSCR